MFEPEGLIKKTVISDLVAAYRIAEEKVRAGCKLLVEAEQGLKDVFGERSAAHFDLHSSRSNSLEFRHPDEIMSRLHKQAWCVIIERMELRRFLSISAGEKLSKQLESGTDLPPITENDIWQMMDGTLQQLDKFVEDAVKECYDWLRPHREGYKTNSLFQVGERVIIGWGCEHGWGRKGKFRLQYNSTQRFTALDRVFHALDGKTAQITTYHGPLVDAVETSLTGKGETEYFEFKCFRNHNVHLRFKRLDLLTKFNAIAGGDKLRPQKDDDLTTAQACSTQDLHVA